MVTDRLGLEVLDEDECLGLVARTTLGRVGLTANALPLILPVNCAVDERSVVFRTVAGSKLAAVARGEVLCFEADGVDADAGEAWSVVIVGRAREITNGDELAAARRLVIDGWVPTAERYVRLGADLVSGRRIRRRPRPEPTADR